MQCGTESITTCVGTRSEASGDPWPAGLKGLVVHYQVELPAVDILMEMLDSSNKGQGFLVQLAVVPFS